MNMLCNINCGPLVDISKTFILISHWGLTICILSAVLVLSAVAKINEAVDVRDPERTLKALTSPEACIPNLDETNADRYQTQLRESKQAKSEVSSHCVDDWFIGS